MCIWLWPFVEDREREENRSKTKFWNPFTNNADQIKDCSHVSSMLWELIFIGYNLPFVSNETNVWMCIWVGDCGFVFITNLLCVWCVCHNFLSYYCYAHSSFGHRLAWLGVSEYLVFFKTIPIFFPSNSYFPAKNGTKLSWKKIKYVSLKSDI